MVLDKIKLSESIVNRITIAKLLFYLFTRKIFHLIYLLFIFNIILNIRT